MCCSLRCSPWRSGYSAHGWCRPSSARVHSRCTAERRLPDTSGTGPEDRRHHRPRDRRCECHRYTDEPESEQDRIFDTLRAEMQANTTDVLVNAPLYPPTHGDAVFAKEVAARSRHDSEGRPMINGTYGFIYCGNRGL